MRKAVLLLFVLILALVIVVGCDGQSESESTAVEETTNSETTTTEFTSPQNPEPTPQPVQPSKESNAQIQSSFTARCAGNVNVKQVTVGSDTATSRRIAVTYIPGGPKGSSSYNNDVFLLSRNVALAQETALDLGRAVFLPVDEAGDAISSITIQVSDIMAWNSGQITDVDFQARWDTW